MGFPMVGKGEFRQGGRGGGGGHWLSWHHAACKAHRHSALALGGCWVGVELCPAQAFGAGSVPRQRCNPIPAPQAAPQEEEEEEEEEEAPPAKPAGLGLFGFGKPKVI